MLKIIYNILLVLLDSFPNQWLDTSVIISCVGDLVDIEVIVCDLIEVTLYSFLFGLAEGVPQAYPGHGPFRSIAYQMVRHEAAPTDILLAFE